jgi:hypothetical protein
MRQQVARHQNPKFSVADDVSGNKEILARSLHRRTPTSTAR